MTIRVLICDSTPVVRYGLAEMLGAEPDIDVVATADDGLEALALVDRVSPDVLIRLNSPWNSHLTLRSEFAKHISRSGLL